MGLTLMGWITGHASGMSHLGYIGQAVIAVRAPPTFRGSSSTKETRFEG
jgi:hypothetical protein